MHRSTRLRRLAVAFLVVLALAVAVRFARAACPSDVSATPDRSSLGGARIEHGGERFDRAVATETHRDAQVRIARDFS